MAASPSVPAATAGLLAWGQDHQEQLGLNRSNYSAKPVIISDTGPLVGKQITRVVDGNDHALALTADGLLFAWVDNDDGQLGTGNTRPENRPAPVPMSAFNGKTVIGIAAGWDFSLAWTSDGAVFAWGRSEAGQCGLFTPRVLTPRLINTGALATRSITKVVAGNYFALAITSTEELVGWGDNQSSQLGNGSTTNSDVPLLISEAAALSGLQIKEVAAGNFQSLAVDAGGRVFSWGASPFGSLGRGGQTSMPGLVDMSGVLAGKKVKKVTAGYSHAMVLTDDGMLYAWGDNYFYTFLGNYALQGYSSVTPCAVRMEEFGTRRIVQISSSYTHNMALADDGTLYAWGRNSRGCFGNGNLASMIVPVEVMPTGAREGRSIGRISEDMNGRFTHALTTDGKLLGWGADDRLGGMFENLTKSNTNPLTEEELSALKGRVKKFVGECDALMKECATAGDFVTFCRVWESQVEFLQMAVIAKLPRQAPPGTSEETLRAVFMQEGIMKPMGQVLCHTAESSVALKLAGDDAARAGAVAICHAMGVFFKAAGSGQPPAPENIKFVELAMQRLSELARQLQETEAARAYEAIAMLDVFMGMITQKEPENLDTLIESLKRDPEGYLTLTLLMGLSKDRDGSKSSYAIAEIQNAILPSVANRKMCAAGAAHLDDWDAAFRHLDTLRKEAPDDLEIKGQRAVTLLRQSQSKASLDKAAALYADINVDTILEKTASLEADTRSMITRNYILFLGLRHQKENALALLTRAQEAKVVKQKDADEVRELLPK
ncbi:RCC1 domain-containing protein [Brevifollis gellanilyticus]|uniref:RCC1-like domain-containing protein n=1 Tax=Brevifollis gellanilyticus TaxID=748831 RepID=A0A512M5Z0_9BACT|nr:hypothetical protein [Brevifollis gellanilyticus]GEP41771.1 hypothetical protein BGE01nite_10620 [Brevifollis gellanilyticus]